VITLKDISPENTPINAGPNDQFVGENDGGGSVYRGIDGNEYTLYPETTTKRPSYTKAAGEALKDFGDWFTTPQSIGGINSDIGNFLLDTGKAVVHGVYDPIKRMETGTGTVGDLTNTVLNVAGGSAPKALGKGVDKDALGIFYSAPEEGGVGVTSGLRPLTQEDLDYNSAVRKPTSLLDRDRVLPGDNILYRPERAYRFIGKEGFEDFVKTGKLRAKEGSKQQYSIPYFMKGKTSSRYAGNGGDEYVLEAVPDKSTWKSPAGGFEDSPYVGPTEGLSNTDTIRIYKKSPDGGYEVIFDNLKDEALLTESHTKPKFAEGGAVEQDPISGNTIPPGSTANEVRDNVDAKLSEGEYVLPADVVKYFGLDYIEKLIGKAKKGMEELHTSGRIGGQGPDDLPFSPEELQAHETEMSSETTPAPVQMAEGGLVPSEWQITDDNTVDPITGLPLWMKKPVNKPVQNKQDFGMNNGGGQNDYKPQTGLAGSVDQWGPDDFLNYAKNKDSFINKGLETAIGAVVPFGGLLTKARHNYLDKNVPPQLDAMIESGVDRQGNPLSALQIASLKEARANLANGSSDTGIGNTLKRSFDGLFHKGVSPVKASGMAGPSGKSQSSTQSIKSSSSKGNPNGNDSNMTKHFKNGGFVTRRKTS